ncbi:MAG TPA: selenoneine biosynthesis selenosugar synthase SenB [Burkholderiales bacterium]|nr:selenoneine biosynthesis selenosugar synthase SenB [Burkholderiales bacterium]
MRIAIVTPSAASTRTGNRHTAQRYAAFLRDAGHRVRVVSAWDGAECDLMIGLHARKSADSIARFRARCPERPLIVVLTGTDLYRDIRFDAGAQRSLEVATLLVTLQEMGALEVAPRLRPKVRPVYQSARVSRRARPPRREFRVCVLGHLRDEKDPFRAALALRYLPGATELEILQVGDALAPAMAKEAARLARADPRYRWIGGVPHSRALAWLRASHLLVVSSRMEGGANVICEAARAGVPVIASRIRGNVGMLGRDYPGYYPLADERALARLIDRARTDPAFYRRLKAGVAARRPLFAPAAERRRLLAVVHEAGRLTAGPAETARPARHR